MSETVQDQPFRRDELSIGAGAARDTMTVAAWTIVSRVTGMVRVIVIGAILGPTFFGNSYQLTNVLPNLVFYGFLAGSLLSSLLVPALDRHIDAGDRDETARVAGGFLGVEWLMLLVAGPVAILAIPMLLPNGESVGFWQSSPFRRCSVMRWSRRRQRSCTPSVATYWLPLHPRLRTWESSRFSSSQVPSTQIRQRIRADGRGSADRGRIDSRRRDPRLRPVVGGTPVGVALRPRAG